MRLLISLTLVAFLSGTWVCAQDSPQKRDKKRKKSETGAPVLPENPPAESENVPPPVESPPNESAEVAPAQGTERVEGASVLFEKERHGFGKVRQGDLVKHSFRFTNNGTVDLKIIDVKASCGCTVPAWPKNPLKPGESANIDVKFNTAGKMGKQKKSVTVYSNVGVAPNNFTVLYLEGEVTSPTLPTIEIR